jgi:hypothetical protein
VLHEHDAEQSGSQAQLLWQLVEVLHEHEVTQSGSHEHPLWQLVDVSHAQPPTCSQRDCALLHSSPVSHAPPAVQAHPNAPTLHGGGLAPSFPHAVRKSTQITPTQRIGAS